MKDDDQKQAPPVQRRPYTSPAIEETSEFETLALTCAVAQGGCGDPYAAHPPGYYDQS
jgi:hypothetical protein